MLKNYLAAVVFGLISCRVAAQVTVSRQVTISRLVRAGLAPDPLLVSLDSLFAGKEYQAVDTLSLQLMNFYPLAQDRYWVTVGCMDKTTMSKIFSFVARYENGHYHFATPLAWLTRDWQIKEIGRITYHYSSGIDIARARAFDRKNEIIAKKLGLTPENLAYYWGNAYYTDADGQMIDFPRMVSALGTYLQAHPDSTVSSLFRHNAKVFPGLAPEVSARSVISAILFEHIEQTKGVEGVKALINCGKGDDNYFSALNGLTGINRENFDEKVRGLLAGR